jgi:hypothetical protein
MIAMWKKWWTDHGTKIIGFATAAIGVLEYVDDQTIKAVEFVAGPHYGPIVSHGLVAASGLLAARRGFLNTAKKKLEAEQPSDGPH